jgi:hypothetical protein
MPDSRFWLENNGVPKAQAKEMRLIANNIAELNVHVLRKSGSVVYEGKTYTDAETVYNDVWLGEQKRLLKEWQEKQP